MTYLIHFNRNHSPKNGRFISGDGDGDGIFNDRKNQKSPNDSGLSSGSILIDEEYTEEDDEKRQEEYFKKVREENLKEFERREKIKAKEKKKKKTGSSKKSSKKKKKASKAKAVEYIINNSTVSDLVNKNKDTDQNKINITELIKAAEAKYGGIENASKVVRLLNSL